MRKTILAASLATAVLALPGLALAQAAPAAAPASPHTVTGNLGLFSSYRFRGIDQTFGQPAIQGGIDYSHANGLYAGNWDSNVNQGAGYPGGNIEMDFYGGWKKSWGDWGLDVGGIYYYYPGTHSDSLVNNPFGVQNNKNAKFLTGRVDNGELYIAGSWKWISLKYSHAVTDYFGVPDSSGSRYLDLSANYDLGNGWGINGHVGDLNFKGITNGDYTDWKIGATKDIGGWVFALSYIATNAKGDCSPTATSPQPYCFSNGNVNTASSTAPYDKLKDAGRSTAVVSVSKTF
jgi:uncharacterized protein (TIGR02001 family)